MTAEFDNFVGRDFKFHERRIDKSVVGDTLCVDMKWEIADARTSAYFPSVYGELFGRVAVDAYSRRMHISNLLVAEHHRRKGYASVLVLMALSYARRQSLDYVTLLVAPENSVAIALYRAHGFRFEYGGELDPSYPEPFLSMIYRIEE